MILKDRALQIRAERVETIGMHHARRANRTALAAAVLLAGLAIPATALASTSTTTVRSQSGAHAGDDQSNDDNQGESDGAGNQGSGNQGADDQGSDHAGDNQGDDNQNSGDNQGDDNQGDHEGGDDESDHHYAFLDAGFGHGATCPATLNVDRAPAASVSNAEHFTRSTELYRSNFGRNIAGFVQVSGHWLADDGALTQEDTCGFDYTALLNTHIVGDFSLEATYHAEAANQGGIVFNQSSTTTRSGASVVDLTNGGSAIRWGHYNNAGYYTFESSKVISTVAAGQQVTVKVVVHGTSATLFFNGEQVGTMTNVNQAGYVGVLTNQSKVKFDSIVLTGLPSA